jgi:hypothetical protein
VAQTNGSGGSSLLPTTDYGYFDVGGGSIIGATVAEADRGRCFVRIEYLGEENDA